MSLKVLALVLLAAVLHAAWNFAVRRVAGNFHVMWLGLGLASVLSWPCAMVAHRLEPLTLAALPYLLATGIIHTGYFILLARCYERGEISLVYPVARGTGVAGTALIAYALLREPLSCYGVLGIVTVCLGTLILGFSRRQRSGSVTSYSLALGVGLTIIAYSIVDKLAMGHVHPIIYISGMFSLSVIFLTPYVLYVHPLGSATLSHTSKASIVLIGVGSMFTYLLILFAFRLGPVSYIVATRESSVLIAALLGFFFLKEPCTIRKIVGIVTIAVGVMLVKAA